MSATTRIKVSREAMLGKLRASRDKQATDYERAVVEYDSKMGAFMRRLEDEVEVFVDLLGTDTDKALERVESSYEGAKVVVRFPRLRLPSKPLLDTRRLDKMIAILEAASDEFVSIAADDDYARYL